LGYPVPVYENIYEQQATADTLDMNNSSIWGDSDTILSTTVYRRHAVGKMHALANCNFVNLRK